MKNVPARVERAAIKLFAETGSTDISVSDLAREAQVARTTIYNNIPDIPTLFAAIAEAVTDDTNAAIAVLLNGVEDPAEQLSIALRVPLLRMHQDQLLGLFVTRFALHESRLRRFWRGVPTQALEAGIAQGRFDLTPQELPLFLSQMSGALLSIMLLVADGHCGWREAARGLACAQLRALGLDGPEARRISGRDLPEVNHTNRIAV